MESAARVTPQQLEHELNNRIEEQRRQVLLSTARDSALVHVFLVIIYLFSMKSSPHFLSVSYYFCGMIVLVMALRLSLVLYAGDVMKMPKWVLPTLHISVFALGGSWGGLAIAYIGHWGISDPSSMILISIVSAIVAGGSVSFSIDPRVFILFASASLGPLILYGALHFDQDLGPALFLSELIFSVFLVRQSYMSQRFRVQLIYNEDQIREERARAEESARLASLGEMAGGIAHEINNPLAVINMNNRMLLAHAEAGDLTPERVKEISERVQKTVSRISQIVRGLRSFARDGEGDAFQSVSLNAVIDDTLSFCRSRFDERQISLRVINAKDVHAECRPVQIGQVILNILNNSISAVQSLNERWVEVEVGERSGLVQIKITDSGSGIPPNLREKIMEPFFTTKAIGEGTGLGLSIAQGIIKNHGGRLLVDSACRNTRFIIEFPKSQVVIR